MEEHRPGVVVRQVPQHDRGLWLRLGFAGSLFNLRGFRAALPFTILAGGTQNNDWRVVHLCDAICILLLSLLGPLPQI